MAEVRRSPQAQADLEGILGELERRNPSVADRYADAFEEKGRTLARFPEIGRLREEIAPGLRSTLVHPYALLYRVEGDLVQVLRILHGKRDLRTIMRADPGD